MECIRYVLGLISIVVLKLQKIITIFHILNLVRYQVILIDLVDKLKKVLNRETLV